MNWEEVGAIGQVLGSVAVFITLGYLAGQVRHAREETRRAVIQIRSQGVRELAINRANNAQWIGSYVKANASLGGANGSFTTTMIQQCGLSAEEALGLFWEQFAFFQFRAHSIMYVHEMTAAQKSELDGSLRREYCTGAIPVSRLWYESVKGSVNADAVRYIDGLLAQPG